MKPVYLKMKGINSFIEEAVIDFEILMSCGIFGIFGPTGSGKSTILDGITLALYGEMSRKSSNFINMNCELAQVSFRFQIFIGSRRDYLVSREFKRDKKTGNIRTNRARIEEVLENGNKVLADTVSEVTKKCIEIIGLNLSDFTRTVVLPQGKFSEFLKLEGKQRRDMLERLFHLYQYGDQLADKLKQKKNIFETEKNILEGQLMGYEGVSQEALMDKKLQLNQWKEQLKACKLEQEKIEESYSLKKMIREEEIELLNELEKRKQIEQEQLLVERKKNRVDQAQRAEKVRPYWETLETVKIQLEEKKKEIRKLQEKYESLDCQQKEIEKKYKESQLQWEQEIPKLHLEQQDLEEAVKEKRVYDEIKESLRRLEEEKRQQETGLQGLMDEKAEVEKSGLDLQKKLQELKEKKNTLKVDNQWKELIFEGTKLEEKFQKVKEELRYRQGQLKDIEEELGKLHNEESFFKGKREQIELQQVELKKVYKKLEESCPGNMEEIVKMQEQLFLHKSLWQQFEDIKEKYRNQKNQLDQAEKEKKENQKELLELEECLVRLKKDCQNKIKDQAVFTVRASLEQGKPCPVCGSVHWKQEITKDEWNAEEASIQLLEEQIRENEETFIKRKNIAMTVENTILQCKQDMEEMEEKRKGLGKEFLSVTIEDAEKAFYDKKQQVSWYQKQIEELEEKEHQLEKESKELEVQIGNMEGNKEALKKQQKTLCMENKKQKELGMEVERKLEVMQGRTRCKNFLQEQKDIFRKEKEAEKNQLKIEEISKKIEEQEKINGQLEEVKNQLQIQILTLNQKKESLEERKIEKIEILQKKTKSSQIRFQGKSNCLEFWLKEVRNLQDTIQKEYEEVKKKKEEINEIFQDTVRRVKEEEGKQIVLEADILKKQQQLKEALLKEEIDSVEEGKALWLSEQESKKLLQEINSFNEMKNKLEGRIEAILHKLNGQHVTEEEWEQICEEKKECDRRRKELEEQYVTIKNSVEELEIKEKKQKELFGKMEETEHKLAVLDELERLFKGKKFVEYVAAERLYYISLEASKRLKEITNGTYGIEVDRNSRFMIRDYKNGGVLRDASTLSGGETFLASLALALSLSSEIQLKGTAPLEFFFLDEGFGTLDDDLLELVMESLERIQNKRLNIGIISHVEAIKNRVPVKLILTPAQAGLGGSKVRTEKS